MTSLYKMSYLYFVKQTIKAMKILKVKASTEKNPRIETWYAANNYPFGIICTQNRSEALACAQISEEEAICLKVQVSHIFPGTVEEWNRYIAGCIIDTLVANQMTRELYQGTFLK